MLLFDDVTLLYPGTSGPAIEGLSFSVEAGERVALVGPSGGGKTTILALAAGLLHPTAGTVTTLEVGVTELGHRRHRETRRNIATIRQDFALVGPIRVAQNVAAGRLGLASLPRALRTLVRPRDIHGIRAVLEELGIGDKLWNRADRLSGGQQQRTAIARAIYQDAKLLLADEPVSALDPARSASVLTTILAPDPHRSVLTSLHDAPLAKAHCDRLIGLREGRVQFDLPSAQVTDALLDALYQLSPGSDPGEG